VLRSYTLDTRTCLAKKIATSIILIYGGLGGYALDGECIVDVFREYGIEVKLLPEDYK